MLAVQHLMQLKADILLHVMHDFYLLNCMSNSHIDCCFFSVTVLGLIQC